MPDGWNRFAQVASLVTCAATLVGAVVLTAPRGSVAEPVDAVGHAVAPAHEDTPSAALTLPLTGREAFRPEVAKAAPTQVPDVVRASFTLQGWVVGTAPGLGEAWAVEAYRLTPERGAVIERRRVHVEPDGTLSLMGLEEGLWQTALVSPRFAWGPLVDTSMPPEPLRLGDDRTGEILLSTRADGSAPLGVPLRVSLTAIRSPALAGCAVTVQRRLAAQDLTLGEAVTLRQVSEGTYDVTATLIGDHPDWGDRPRSSRARVIARQGVNHVELAFLESGSGLADSARSESLKDGETRPTNF